jgi:ABC-type Fe3+ transport system permease subunit
MNTFEKRICIAAAFFIIIYLGAIFVSITSKTEKKPSDTKIESVQLDPGEGTFMLAQLLLPMAILATLTICFIIVKKTRANARLRLDDDAKASDNK